MVAPRMHGNRSHTVRAFTDTCEKSSSVRFSSRTARPSSPPPISTVPLGNCLKDRVRPVAPTTGLMKGATRAVIISIGAMTSKGTGSPTCAAMRSAQAPAALTTTGASNRAPSAVSTVHRPPWRASRVTVPPSWKRAPSAMALRRKAKVVRKGIAAPSPRDTRAPTQWSAMAGTSDRSSSCPITSSWVKPSAPSSATRARTVSSSASVSATLIWPWLSKPQSSSTRSRMPCHSAIEATVSGTSATWRPSWRTPPALTPEAWRATWSFSRTSTRTPRIDRCSAAEQPCRPPPMTMTSGLGKAVAVIGRLRVSA